MKRRLTSVARALRSLILLSLLLISSAAHSLEHDWSRSYGGTGYDYGYSIAATPDGGVLVAGEFRDTVDFGGGPFSSSGEGDIFIIKLDAAGNHVWSKEFGGSWYDRAMSIAVTPEGAVLVTGLCHGPVDFGGGPLPDSGFNIFIVKLDSNGDHLWSIGYPGGGQNGSGNSIVTTQDGDILVSGDFDGTVDFGGGPLTCAGSIDAFVLKLDSVGNHLWSKCLGSNELDYSGGISFTSDDDYLISGGFGGTVDFGGGPVTSAGERDIYVVKLDSDGNHIWSQTFGGAGVDRGYDISATPDGGAQVTGTFSETVDFGGGAYTSFGYTDIFVLKLDDDGAHLWSRHYGQSSPDTGRSIVTAPDGSILVTGDFYRTVDFGGGPIMSHNNTLDVFALKLDADGNHLWSDHYGGNSYDYGRCIAMAPNGGALLTGHFRFTADFGGGPFTSAGWSDIFVLSLEDDENVGVANFPETTSGWSCTAGPNPFRNTTTLRMTLPRDGDLQVSVYDVGGRLLKQILDGAVAVGPHTLLWDGTNSRGESVPTGVYLVRVATPEVVSTVRVVRLR